MPQFDKLRFNEPLLGRIIASKRTNPDYYVKQNTSLKSTVLPDIKFNSIPEWINHIHTQNKYK